MCFATAALVAGIAGAGVSGVGAISGGVAQQNAANYQAQVATNNQTIALQNEAYAVAAGERAATDQGLKGAATGAKIKAGQAASGIDVNTGSAATVQASQRETSQLDTETVLNNALLQGYGYRAAATGYQAEAGLDTLKGQNAMVAGEIGAVGSTLSAASSIGYKWTGFNPSGTPTGGSAAP